MYAVSTTRQKHVLQLETRLETADLGNGFSAFQLSRTTFDVNLVPLQLQALAQPVVVEGLATAEALERFAAGQSAAIEAVPHCFALSGAALEVARSGYRMLAELFADKSRAHEFGSDVFTAIVERGSLVENLTILDFSSEMLFTVDGTVRATGVACDYISGQLTDLNYDLTRLIQHLAKDERVQFLDGTSSKRVFVGPAKALLAIPHYNSDSGSSWVNFVFKPTDADMQALWGQCKSYPGMYPWTHRYRALFDRDILGLRKAGIAKQPSFFGTPK